MNDETKGGLLKFLMCSGSVVPFYLYVFVAWGTGRIRTI